MKKIGVIKKFNKIRMNKALNLKSRNILERYGIKINNFLGYIDLFYNLKEEIPEIDNVYDEMNLRFKLFNNKINKSTNKNIIIEKIKKEYINESNEYKNNEVYKKFDKKVITDNKEDYLFNNIEKYEINNLIEIENKNMSWENSYERRIIETIKFNENRKEIVDRENRIYSNKYFGHLKNHSSIQNIEKLYFEKLRVEKSYSNEMIEKKQYPFLERKNSEKREVGRGDFESIYVKNVAEYSDNHIKIDEFKSKRYKTIEYQIRNLFEKSNSNMSSFQSINKSEIKLIKKKNIFNEIFKNLTQNISGNINIENNEIEDINHLVDYGKKNRKIVNVDIEKKVLNDQTRQINNYRESLFNSFGDINLEKSTFKFAQEILKDDIVFLKNNSHKESLKGSNYFSTYDYVEKLKVENTKYEQELSVGELLKKEIVREKFFDEKNNNVEYNVTTDLLFENMVNIENEKRRIQNKNIHSIFNYKLNTQINKRNSVEDLKEFKESYIRYMFMEKFMLKEYGKAVSRKVSENRFGEDYRVRIENKNFGDFNKNIVSNAYNKFKNLLVSNYKKVIINTIEIKNRRNYMGKVNQNNNYSNYGNLSYAEEIVNIEKNIENFFNNKFNGKRKNIFKKKLLNSIDIKNNIKRNIKKNTLNEKTIKNRYNQNIDISYKMNISLEEVNSDIHELRLGNQALVNNNQKLTRFLNDETLNFSIIKDLRENNLTINEGKKGSDIYLGKNKNPFIEEQYIKNNRFYFEKNSAEKNYKDLIKTQKETINKRYINQKHIIFKSEERYDTKNNKNLNMNQTEYLQKNIFSTVTRIIKNSQEEFINNNSQFKFININKNIDKVLNKNFKGNVVNQRDGNYRNSFQNQFKNKIFALKKILNSNLEKFSKSEKNLFHKNFKDFNFESLEKKYHNTLLFHDNYDYQTDSYVNKKVENKNIEEREKNNNYNISKEIINVTKATNYIKEIIENREKNIKNLNRKKNISYNNKDDIKKTISTKAEKIFQIKITRENTNYEILREDRLGRIQERVRKEANLYNHESNEKTIIKNISKYVVNKNQYKNSKDEERIFLNHKKYKKINEFNSNKNLKLENNVNKNIEINIRKLYETDTIRNIKNKLFSPVMKEALKVKEIVNKNIDNNFIENHGGIKDSKNIFKYIFEDKKIWRNIVGNAIKTNNYKSNNYLNYTLKKNNNYNISNDQIKFKKDIKYFDLDQQFGAKEFKNINFRNNDVYKNIKNETLKNFYENNNEEKINRELKREFNNRYFQGFRNEKINILKDNKNIFNLNRYGIKDGEIFFKHKINKFFTDNRKNKLNEISNKTNESRINLNNIFNFQKFIEKNETNNNGSKNQYQMEKNISNNIFKENNIDFKNEKNSKEILVSKLKIYSEDNSKNYIDNNNDKNILYEKFDVNKFNLRSGKANNYKKFIKRNLYNLVKNKKNIFSNASKIDNSNNENIFKAVLKDNRKEVNSSEYNLLPFYGQKKNIFRMSNINDSNKGISLNVKNYSDNYENHTFKQVKNVILSNDGNDIENNYDYSTDIIFKDKEQRINQEEVLNIISQRQKNMEIEIKNIIDKKIKNQGDEINITTIASQVYRDIERKMKYEKRRKGMI